MQRKPAFEIHADGSTSRELQPAADSFNRIIHDAGCHRESFQYAFGTAALLSLVFVTASAPAMLPLVFLGFAAIVLPYRVLNFVSRKWTFFLVDFCYVSRFARL